MHANTDNREFDAKSDELVSIFVDDKRSKHERSVASQTLYQTHAEWVVRQIGKKVFNPDDVQDIAQTVWMIVLQPEKLRQSYTEHDGKFGAYLHAPIRWAILKHLNKLPYSLDDDGQKISAQFVDVTETAYQQTLDRHTLQETIDNIIKPNLQHVDIKSRIAYLANEYDMLFEQRPTLEEIAYINALETKEAKTLYTNAEAKDISERSDSEVAVYITMNYENLVDPELLKAASGRHLSSLCGVTETAFRKRLYTARKYLLEITKQNLLLPQGDPSHG